MSLVLSKLPRLKAELRLAQAVSEFQQDLSTEQKTQFRTISTAAPPDCQDVMRLTAEIDRHAAELLNSRRCFGPRVTNVLHAVQQFAALGDVMVGGSQNILACGVWTLVRMTLLTTVNFSSYLEQLSALFMRIGRSAPRYQRLKELYPQSKALRTYLYEYFTVVVRLCHQVLKLTKKSTIGRVVAFLSDTDTKTYQSELDDVAALIKEEMTLLMARDITEQGSGIKALVRSAESEAQRQKLGRRSRLLDACSTYDHETTWKETQKLGTASWFREVDEYKYWRARTDSATLICSGKLGSGKSVLMANVVSDMSLYIRTRTCPLAYFFCRHDIFESLQARTVIGSLAQQLLQTLPDLSRAYELVDDNTSHLDNTKLLEILRHTLPRDFQAYFVIDGWDECPRPQRRELIQQFRQIQDIIMLRICIACRSDIDGVWTLKPENVKHGSIMSVPEENPEIKEFIKKQLVDCIESERLVFGDFRLCLEIEDALVAGAQGMFLWAALQITSLCEAKTDEAIRRALVELPQDLPGTFARILENSAKGAYSELYQKRILEFVIAARRPLTTGELGEALSVCPGDDEWNPDRLINNIFSVLASCGSLLVVDEENLTVRLIHHSVRQFLLDYGKRWIVGATSTFDAQANETMRATVFTFLNYGVFDTQLSTKVAPRLSAEAAPSKIIRSMDAGSMTRNLALRLLRNRGQRDFDVGRYVAEARKEPAKRPEDRFPFLSYAKSHWIGHAYGIGQDDTESRRMLVKLLNRRFGPLSVNDAETQRLAFWAAAEGYASILLTCLESGVDLEVKHEITNTPLLFFAAAYGHESCVDLLAHRGAVEKGLDFLNQTDGTGRTALSWAAGLGHLGAVESLLKNEVEVDLADHLNWTPLLWTCFNGSVPVVRKLVEYGADPIIQSRATESADPQTPLLLSVKRGDADLLKLLLSKGLPPNLPLDGTSSMKSLICDAAMHGQAEIVRVFMKHGVPMVNYGGRATTAYNLVCIAAAAGRGSVVRTLLEHGANVRTPDAFGRTALNEAVKQGHHGIVKVLIDAGADVNHNDGPLWEAVIRGHHAVITTLVAAGAHKNAKKAKCTALSRLIIDNKDDNFDTVKLLVDLDFDLEVMDDQGMTPLVAAASKGREDLVRILLDAGASMEHRDFRGLNALEEAAFAGHEACFKLLLERGSVFNPPLARFRDMISRHGDMIASYREAITNDESRQMLQAHSHKFFLGMCIMRSCAAGVEDQTEDTCISRQGFCSCFYT